MYRVLTRALGIQPLSYVIKDPEEEQDDDHGEIMLGDINNIIRNTSRTVG